MYLIFFLTLSYHANNDTYIYQKTISEVPSIIPSTTNQEDVSKEFYVSQFELDDKFLPSQIPETRIVVHASAKKDEATPVQPQRNRRPSRWNSSPYQSNFDSGGK